MAVITQFTLAQLSQAVVNFGEFASIQQAVNAGFVNTFAGATGQFTIIEGGAAAPVISFQSALEAAHAGGSLVAGQTTIETTGVGLLQTETGFKLAPILSMNAGAVAAAVAPVLGVALGVGWYEANPKLWTDLSTKLLPFCYPGTTNIPTWLDIALDTGTGQFVYKLLVKMGIVEAIDAVLADYTKIPQYTYTNPVGGSVIGSAVAEGMELYPNHFVRNVDGSTEVFRTTESGADVIWVKSGSFSTATTEGYDWLNYTPGSIINFQNTELNLPSNAPRTIREVQEIANDPFSTKTTSYPADGIEPWAGNPAPAEPVVFPFPPIIVIPEDEPWPIPETTPVTPVTPVPLLPPHEDPPLLPEHPTPDPDTPPDNWPEEEPWPTVVPFPWPDLPDAPTVIPFPLPEEPPSEWPTTPQIPEEWPEEFPEEEPWPHNPSEWPEEVPWPDEPPTEWPEEVPWPETPDDWPEEVPWPTPWPEEWPEDEPWPVEWPVEIPYPIPYPDPYPSPDPETEPDPGTINDPEPVITPWVEPSADPQTSPDPTNEDTPDPSIDPTIQVEPEAPYVPPSVDPDSPFAPSDPDAPIAPDLPPPSGTSPLPPLPTTPSGFDSTYGLISVYNPTQAELFAFCNWLWVTYADATIDKIWNNPFDGIITLFELYCTPTINGRKTIRSGFLDSNILSDTVSRYTQINCGTIGIPEYYGNYFDYSPYSKAHIYLPFIGIQELNVDDIVGHYVNVTYRIDEYNGSCIAMITVAKVSEYQGEEYEYSNTMYQFSGNCAVEYPLTGGSQAAIRAGMMTAEAYQNAYNVAAGASLLGGIGSLLGGNIGGAISGAAGAATQYAFGQAAYLQNMLSGKSTVQKSGTFGASHGALGIKTPFITIIRPRQIDVPNYNELYGYPAHKMVTIGTCTGYLRCREVHVRSATATDEEKTIIEQLLKAGVYMS